MAIYIGFWTFTPDFARAAGAQVRQGELPPEESLDAAFLTKVQGFPAALPEGCTILGSYAPTGLLADIAGGQAQPGVDIFETADPSQLLSFVTAYYAGYLTWQIHPYTPV